MKLAVIIGAAQSIEWAKKLKMKNGMRAIKLRQEIIKLDPHYKAYEETKAEYIKATGKERINQDDPEFKEIVARLNEALSVEIDIALNPIIEQSDLENVEASAEEIDGLILLGLISLNDTGKGN